MPRGKQLSEAELKKRNEERSKKFKELGTKRLNKALQTIRMLIPLSNTNQYGYTEDQAKRVGDHLDEAVKEVKSAFAGKKVSSGGVEL